MSNELTHYRGDRRLPKEERNFGSFYWKGLTMFVDDRRFATNGHYLDIGPGHDSFCGRLFYYGGAVKKSQVRQGLIEKI